jgi:hypothetical protein
MNEPTHNKHAMNKKLLFLGFDVHAQNIALAFAEGEDTRGHEDTRGQARMALR